MTYSNRRGVTSWNQFDSGDWDTESSVKHGRIEMAVLESNSTQEENKRKCWEVDENIIRFKF
jgi:hypothetical protein